MSKPLRTPRPSHRDRRAGAARGTFARALTGPGALRIRFPPRPLKVQRRARERYAARRPVRSVDYGALVASAVFGLLALLAALTL